MDEMITQRERLIKMVGCEVGESGQVMASGSLKKCMTWRNVLNLFIVQRGVTLELVAWK